MVFSLDLSGPFLLIVKERLHDTLLPHGEDWRIHIESPTTLVLYGLHPGIVGSVGAHLRDLRRPDPYKAKGVRVEGVLYTLREGKKK